MNRLIDGERIGFPAVSPVDREISRLKSGESDYPIYDSEHRGKLLSYLKVAREHGMKDESAVSSCRDMAKRHSYWERHFGWEKQQIWESLRRESLKEKRDVREITMKLHPEYFRAILDGRKPFEGRAWNKDSPKGYQDIRYGDKIIFTIWKEIPDWQPECMRLGINGDMVMTCSVEEVFFSYSVHDMFMMCEGMGEQFQPQVGHVHLFADALKRASIYYQFPGYQETIEENGFLAIKLADPRLLTGSGATARG